MGKGKVRAEHENSILVMEMNIVIGFCVFDSNRNEPTVTWNPRQEYACTRVCNKIIQGCSPGMCIKLSKCFHFGASTWLDLIWLAWMCLIFSD